MYQHQDSIHNPTAAQTVVPLLRRIGQPESVVDVGCGLGDWLHVFQKQGVEDIQGIDGEWVDTERLYIPKDKFRVADLNRKIPVERRFDLALCLEVAEHLQPESAWNIVASLVGLSDNIAFSAAIPRQGGQNHFNEQWADYWAALFAEHGYVFQDVIRPEIWDDESVFWWYRQNMFWVTKHPLPDASASHRNMIHPELWESVLEQQDKILDGRLGMRFYIRLFWKGLKTFSKRRLTGKDV